MDILQEVSSIAAKRALLYSGLSVREAAERLGVRSDYLSTVLHSSRGYRRLRRRFEQLVGCPIWSTNEDFQRDFDANRLLGADSIRMPVVQLRRELRRLKIPTARRSSNRDELMRALHEFIQKHPHMP